MSEVVRGMGYDRTTKVWLMLAENDYVIAKDGELWRVTEVLDDGRVRVKGGPKDERKLWAAQPADREVPIAILHPVDPVAMMRDMLGATPLAWKRHDDDTWTAAPWPAGDLPGNHPFDDYLAHMREWHGLRPHPKMTWEEARQMHAEHHTPGIAHPVKHIHHLNSLGI